MTLLRLMVQTVFHTVAFIIATVKVVGDTLQRGQRAGGRGLGLMIS